MKSWIHVDKGPSLCYDMKAMGRNRNYRDAQKAFGTVRLLLDCGAVVDAVGSIQCTALAKAIHYEIYDAARLLLDRGGNPMIAFDEGRSPIHEMIYAGKRRGSRVEHVDMTYVIETLCDLIPTHHLYDDDFFQLFPSKGQQLAPLVHA